MTWHDMSHVLIVSWVSLVQLHSSITPTRKTCNFNINSCNARMWCCVHGFLLLGLLLLELFDLGLEAALLLQRRQVWKVLAWLVLHTSESNQKCVAVLRDDQRIMAIEEQETRISKAQDRACPMNKYLHEYAYMVSIGKGPTSGNF